MILLAYKTLTIPKQKRCFGLVCDRHAFFCYFESLFMFLSTRLKGQNYNDV